MKGMTSHKLFLLSLLLLFLVGWTGVQGAPAPDLKESTEEEISQAITNDQIPELDLKLTNQEGPLNLQQKPPFSERPRQKVSIKEIQHDVADAIEKEVANDNEPIDVNSREEQEEAKGGRQGEINPEINPEIIDEINPEVIDEINQEVVEESNQEVIDENNREVVEEIIQEMNKEESEPGEANQADRPQDSEAPEEEGKKKFNDVSEINELNENEANGNGIENEAQESEGEKEQGAPGEQGQSAANAKAKSDYLKKLQKINEAKKAIQEEEEALKQEMTEVLGNHVAGEQEGESKGTEEEQEGERKGTEEEPAEEATSGGSEEVQVEEGETLPQNEAPPEFQEEARIPEFQDEAQPPPEFQEEAQTPEFQEEDQVLDNHFSPEGQKLSFEDEQANHGGIDGPSDNEEPALLPGNDDEQIDEAQQPAKVINELGDTLRSPDDVEHLISDDDTTGSEVEQPILSDAELPNSDLLLPNDADQDKSLNELAPMENDDDQPLGENPFKKIESDLFEGEGDDRPNKGVLEPEDNDDSNSGGNLEDKPEEINLTDDLTLPGEVEEVKKPVITPPTVPKAVLEDAVIEVESKGWHAWTFIAIVGISFAVLFFLKRHRKVGLLVGCLSRIIPSLPAKPSNTSFQRHQNIGDLESQYDGSNTRQNRASPPHAEKLPYSSPSPPPPSFHSLPPPNFRSQQTAPRSPPNQQESWGDKWDSDGWDDQ